MENSFEQDEIIRKTTGNQFVPKTCDDKGVIFIERLQAGITGKSKGSILSVYDDAQNDASFSWEKVSDSLFERWDKLTDEANDILHS